MPPPSSVNLIQKNSQYIEYDNNYMKYELNHDTELFTLKTRNHLIYIYSGKTKFIFVDMLILSKTSYQRKTM